MLELSFEMKFVYFFCKVVSEYKEVKVVCDVFWCVFFCEGVDVGLGGL